MKRQNGKRLPSGMKFFTPELYLSFNSPNDAEADRADQAWEQAIQAYQRHLDGLRDRMPSDVRKLAELCLHDAEVLALDKAAEPAVAVLSLRQHEQVTVLIYALWDSIRESAPPKGWQFSKQRLHWLYDEIDAAKDHGFRHRILLSDGKVVEIPFTKVVMHSFTLPARIKASQTA